MVFLSFILRLYISFAILWSYFLVCRLSIYLSIYLSKNQSRVIVNPQSLSLSVSLSLCLCLSLSQYHFVSLPQCFCVYPSLYIYLSTYLVSFYMLFFYQSLNRSVNQSINHAPFKPIMFFFLSGVHARARKKCFSTLLSPVRISYSTLSRSYMLFLCHIIFS